MKINTDLGEQREQREPVKLEKGKRLNISGREKTEYLPKNNNNSMS